MNKDKLQKRFYFFIDGIGFSNAKGDKDKEQNNSPIDFSCGGYRFGYQHGSLSSEYKQHHRQL